MTFTPSAENGHTGSPDLDIEGSPLIEGLRPRYCPCPNVDVLLGRCELHSPKILFLDVGYFAVDPFHWRLCVGVASVGARVVWCCGDRDLGWSGQNSYIDVVVIAV